MDHMADRSSFDEYRISENGNGRGDIEERRYCRICFEYDEEREEVEWIKPCRCKGTMRWVHNECLLQWIDQRQKTEPNKEVCCRICKTKYTVVFRNYGKLLSFIGSLRKLAHRFPFLSTFVSMMAGSLFFGAVQSKFQRVLLGGFAFLVVEGILNVYYEHQVNLQQNNRTIKDFEEVTLHLPAK